MVGIAALEPPLVHLSVQFCLSSSGISRELGWSLTSESLLAFAEASKFLAAALLVAVAVAIGLLVTLLFT